VLHIDRHVGMRWVQRIVAVNTAHFCRNHFHKPSTQVHVMNSCRNVRNNYSNSTMNTRQKQTHTHTHPFNGPFSRTTQVSRYQNGKTNLDFTEARDSEWQWHQLGHMQVCTSLQTDNHTSTQPLCFLQAGCPSCRPTNSIKALNAREKQTGN